MAKKPVHELKQLVGTTWTAVNRFPIEAGKIAEFAEAITEDNPAYTDTSGEAAAKQGFDDVPAPPTYTMASSFFSRRQETERSPDLGLDLENTLHGEQTFEFERIPVAGDVLHGEGEISDVYLREGSSGRMLFIERTTTFYDQRDSPVVSSVNTIIDTNPTVED